MTKNCRKENPVTDETVCSICDFPLDPYSENGWFDDVVISEHLFLRNIYSPLEMKISLPRISFSRKEEMFT